MTDFFSLTPPSRCGHLAVEAPHEVYWEERGPPGAPAALVIHGGPGSGTGDELKRLCDPTRLRAIVFDQRGCGRSRPFGALDGVTLPALVADVERLRAHLGIERWRVVGGSWGSTVAIAYAEAWPRRVERLILWGTWLFRPVDVQWWLYGVRAVFPEAWRRFAAHVSEAERGDLLAAYRRRLFDEDPAIHRPAAVIWKSYERRLRRLTGWDKVEDLPESDRVVTASRQMAHYFAKEGVTGAVDLLAAADRLAGVPGTIVHGRYDMICPFDNAHALAARWPAARLVEAPDAGHALEEPGILRAVLAAIHR